MRNEPARRTLADRYRRTLADRYRRALADRLNGRGLLRPTPGPPLTRRTLVPGVPPPAPGGGTPLLPVRPGEDLLRSARRVGAVYGEK
ncbi:hypothetical protein ACFCX0_45570 [Streptomyces sp. NPDC056352]|uniref:hypothetical protein n=1 Tax=Streptomyces sp. NPDC056352 TaxID=3345791 RepID=UPI0035DED64D